MRATSIAAMEKVAPKRESMKGRVYQYLIDRQERGATDQEMQSALNIPGDSLRPIRISLFKDGWIHDSGHTRQNPNGNECIVWVVSSFDPSLF